ncbi:PREDICTED: C2 and GRAM domain-containing protein At5g50170 isoform X2 [Nelumbo nucifera]|uniref:C2 and GRAM domain-containing protein At5g50170 isoform X2 n=1 Tax=Nelumbo nucifera TaxID=4432 RepID=A0A1U7ZBX8_NELNU|nr:PREDICTED: C2 and GRAM domain-containing protein At5g50170 isoform X2 [Nelumbo nucifera]
MRLYVYVLEGKDLSVKDSVEGFYVKLRVGKYKSRTRVVNKALNPVWYEEFVFSIHDLDEEIIVSLFHPNDYHGFFNVSSNLIGRVRVPLWSVLAEEKNALPPTWFSLEKSKSAKAVEKDCGKILLTLCLCGRINDTSNIHTFLRSGSNTKDLKEQVDPAEQSQGMLSSVASFRKIPEWKQLVKVIASWLERLLNKNEETVTCKSTTDYSSELYSTTSDYQDSMDEPTPGCSFEEAIDLIKSRDEKQELPEDLPGGILLDQTYMVSSRHLNSILFEPNSQFKKDLAELQGITDLQEGPWTWKLGKILTRVITYTKPATKLVKAIKATEDQTYLYADGREFVVLTDVSTPDAPYGHYFKMEFLYRIMPGPESSVGEEFSRLVVSWNINFLQRTVMRRMIEGRVQQGMKESNEQFARLLSQKIRPIGSTALLDKEQMLAKLQQEHQSNWELAIEYFWNFNVVSTIFMVLYVLLHIFLSGHGIQGLEFNGLDLPDTFGELITCGILALQVEHVFNMISHFVQARLKRGSDRGVKSRGDGWVLTVALVEGNNLASLDSTGLSDPYVVFTCNGKSRTSSIKLQTSDPQWNEVLEFDAMEEPPSVLDVEVFDFDGPFDLDASLGHVEINFLKHTSTELADMWVTLEGKLAQISQSKLHVRIFLENSKGVETVKEYLTKMEKEVGKKLDLQTPYRNSTFQKIFGLPPEEFLIDDFSCSLKRKMPLQGRLFLSARIIGFYANLFGHKTKFFFLWEDIEDIQLIPPSLSSVGSPSLIIILHKGQGLDAKHGAKSQDEEGRLRFHFQSFVSFNVASRTIMALWRTRTSIPEQKDQIEETHKDHDGKPFLIGDTGSFWGLEDMNMSKIYFAELLVHIELLMEVFGGGDLEHRVMEKSGCLNYATTPWEATKPNVYERHICYKFNHHVSIYGAEVISIQQKSPTEDGNGWTVVEVMTLHEVPFGPFEVSDQDHHCCFRCMSV